jgi:hypothetical protein
MSIAEATHNFAIDSIARGPGWFAPSRHRYYCVRCHWMFLVQGSDVTALNDAGEPLPKTENNQRTATFAVGPCPALPAGCLPRTRGKAPLEWLIGFLRPSRTAVPAMASRLSPKHNVLDLENAAQRRRPLTKADYAKPASGNISFSDAEGKPRSHIRVLTRPSAGS